MKKESRSKKGKPGEWVAIETTGDEVSGRDAIIVVVILLVVSIVASYFFGSLNGASNYRRMVNDRNYCVLTGIDRTVCEDIYK